ncbi:MAG: FkbM family methyltransferase [Vicinamibacterales bacterium]
MLRAVVRHVPRGRYRLVSAAPARGRFIASLSHDLGGARFHCDMSNELSREACLTGMYEPPVSRLIRAHVTAGGTMVDAGANWGYFSLVAAAAVGPNGTVLALEPDPRQFAALTANAALNKYDRIDARQVAAATGDGQATLHGYNDSDTNRGVSRLDDAPGDGPVGRSFTVRCIALDDLVGGACVDVVKIDVEGAEDLVLGGMRRGLNARRYRTIVLELHPALLRQRGVEPETVIQTLADHGYRGATIDMSASAYRRAIHRSIRPDSLLLPLDRWHESRWPHLLWRC